MEYSVHAAGIRSYPKPVRTRRRRDAGRTPGDRWTSHNNPIRAQNDQSRRHSGRRSSLWAANVAFVLSPALNQDLVRDITQPVLCPEHRKHYLKRKENK